MRAASNTLQPNKGSSETPASSARRPGRSLQPNKGSSETVDVERYRPDRDRFNPTRVRLKRLRPRSSSSSGGCFNPTRVRLKRLAAGGLNTPTTGVQPLQPNKGSSETKNVPSYVTFRICFNPTRVRLKRRRTRASTSASRASFNPTRVRLKLFVIIGAIATGIGFNPTRVRLKLADHVGRLRFWVAASTQQGFV